MFIMCVLGVVRYASESIDLACKYAYKNAAPGTTLGGILTLWALEKMTDSLWNKIILAFLICNDVLISLTFSADDYFLSRLPIVEKRIAQGGIRLAATLNRIFSPKPSLAAAWN